MDGLNALPHGIRELKLAPLEEHTQVADVLFWIGMMLAFLACGLIYYFWRSSRSRQVSDLSETINAISNLSIDDPGFTHKVSKLLKLGLYQRFALDLRASSSLDFQVALAEWSVHMQTMKPNFIPIGAPHKNRKFGEIIGPIKRFSRKNLSRGWKKKESLSVSEAYNRIFLISGEIKSCLQRLEEDLFAGKGLARQERESIKLDVRKWIEEVR